jgi:hypothetical protein
LDLPTFKNNYKHGVINLKSLNINSNDENDENNENNDIMKFKNMIEFLRMITKFCNGIINFELCIRKKLNEEFIKIFMNIIRLQPLKRLFIISENMNIKKIYNNLEFRSKTLNILIFENINFQKINSSFIILLKLECLEQLEFKFCFGFTSKHYETLHNTKKKLLQLKELKWWDGNDENIKLHAAIINSLCGEALLNLDSNIFTSGTVKILKETCPNLNTLCMEFYLPKQNQFFDSIISLICELKSLKILHIKADHVDKGLIVKSLGNYLISIEYLFLNFFVDLPNFKYFTDNCKANLKSLSIKVDTNLKDYLMCVDDFQKAHNSLKRLGIRHDYGRTPEGIEIIKSLRSKGVKIMIMKE